MIYNYEQIILRVTSTIKMVQGPQLNSVHDNSVTKILR